MIHYLMSFHVLAYACIVLTVKHKLALHNILQYLHMLVSY